MSVLCVLLLRLSPAQGLDSLDVRLFRTINDAQNQQRNGLFEHLDNTSLPSFVAAPVLFMTLGLLQHAPKVFGTGAIMGSAEVVSLAATAVLKPLIGRPRPFETLEDVKVKHEWSALGASLPSGHSASAFAVATVLSLRYPHAPVIGASSVWAILVACGRVYLGVHYPSDVLAGAALGSGLGLLVWQYRNELDHFADRVTAPSRKLVFAGEGFLLSRIELARWSITLD